MCRTTRTVFTKRPRFNVLVTVAAVMALFCAPGAAEAAAILWTSGPTTITSVNDISLNGTLVHAGTWGSSQQSVTVGSETIVFEDRPKNTTDGEAGATGTTAWWGEYSHPDLYIGDTGSAAFNAVLDSFVDDAPNPMVITLQGLTAGENYQVQLFASDDRGCCGARTQKWSDQSADGGPNETAVYADNQSVYAIGTFVADGPEQFIYTRGVSSGNNITNGYVLRLLAPAVVPEPSTLLIWSLLAGVGIAARWRRRR